MKITQKPTPVTTFKDLAEGDTFYCCDDTHKPPSLVLKTNTLIWSDNIPINAVNLSTARLFTIYEDMPVIKITAEVTVL